jgi:hypothetical protein
MLYKIRNQIYRKLLKFFSLNKRPSSYPYISGDSFRALAQNIYDETFKCSPESIAENSIVFVKSDLLLEFFNSIHPKIKTSYILISHNSDENITEKYIQYIDNKIIHWFAQNCMITNPKISPIPIGLDNLYFSYFGDTHFFKKTIKTKRDISKKNAILFGFSVNTNPKERGEALEALQKTKTAFTKKGFVPFHVYTTQELAQYKFVASPPGNGIDSPRQWQAMYLNTIPILKENENTNYFIECNLPILKVRDWNELKNYTEEDLEKKYATIIENSDSEALWMDYWINKIKNEQK